jgi:transcriptional regulator of acetoin/glycerol metabolism
LLSYGRGVYVKYYSIAFAILPGVAGGLALELLIQPHHFPPAVTSAQPIAKTIKKNLLNRADMKKKQLIEALESANGNQSRAADILGISRVTVWNRMKKYGITTQKNINS